MAAGRARCGRVCSFANISVVFVTCYSLIVNITSCITFLPPASSALSVQFSTQQSHFDHLVLWVIDNQLASFCFVLRVIKRRPASTNQCCCLTNYKMNTKAVNERSGNLRPRTVCPQRLRIIDSFVFCIGCFYSK